MLASRRSHEPGRRVVFIKTINRTFTITCNEVFTILMGVECKKCATFALSNIGTLQNESNNIISVLKYIAISIRNVERHCYRNIPWEQHRFVVFYRESQIFAFSALPTASRRTASYKVKKKCLASLQNCYCKPLELYIRHKLPFVWRYSRVSSLPYTAIRLPCCAEQADWNLFQPDRAPLFVENTERTERCYETKLKKTLVSSLNLLTDNTLDFSVGLLTNKTMK